MPGLQVVIEIGQLLLQAPLFQHIVDGPALAEVGLGHFGLRLSVFFCDLKLVVDSQVFFIGAHASLQAKGPLAVLIAGFTERVKKIFSIVLPVFLLLPQSSDVLCLYSHRSSIRQLPQRGLRAWQT